MFDRTLTGCAVWLLALSYTSPASANCAAPVTYEFEVESNTVIIKPLNEFMRGCPAPDGLLRQNRNTGETVRLPDECGPDKDHFEYYENRSFIDECVPAGTYRYGFAEPYDCVSYACGTYRFAEVEVRTSLGNCERTHPDAVPTPVAQAPWHNKSDTICDYAGSDDEGCAAVPPGGRAVLTIDLSAGAVALGVLLMRRRRRG